ncbi:EthD domain-containing protein [Spongiibacter nanhainus]|uniref:EthD domain-containing protein n=1 Tax=Spongiibacter nanhainus TaxID=2794344 RepID=A0A7T4UR46_9GAMM|nr:EthD domain-containing protein [Spongiibacter nanhainus]QQD19341.1 EthD domain-containing protein [Spongiibacter nanhainus]
MTKLQLLLWSGGDTAALHEALFSLAPELLRRTEAEVQVNLADEAVRPAADKRMASSGVLPDAVLSFWSRAPQGEAGTSDELAQIKSALEPGDQWAVYAVEHAEPLADTQRSVGTGERTPGFSQVALLQCPDFLNYEQWLDHWKNVHTSLAIDTQSTFRYVQNRVLQQLDGEHSAVAAIVEECFPAQAMTDPLAFYDAQGDEARFQANSSRMMESCAKFIDFSRIDVLPTSEYRWCWGQ